MLRSMGSQRVGHDRVTELIHSSLLGIILGKVFWGSRTFMSSYGNRKLCHAVY